MSSAVITGIGCVSSSGTELAALREALRLGRPSGTYEPVETARGRRREIRVSRVGPLKREAFLPAFRLRRMCDNSQVWTIACMLARSDARLGADFDPYPPERRGTFVGTGLGCLGPTWEFLRGLSVEGVVSPFAFAESVANAPGGHSAIELETRGACETLTCGDGSAAAATIMAARAVAERRIGVAYCGGVELLSGELLRVVATLRGPGFVGEGSACLVLESAESADARGARAYAEIAAVALGSDPDCGPWDWSADADRIARVMERAISRLDGSSVDTVFLHAGGATEAEDAEHRAVLRLLPRAEVRRPSRVVGSLAAAGGLTLAAAAAEVAQAKRRTAAVVLASSWGGGLFAIALRGGGP